MHKVAAVNQTGMVSLLQAALPVSRLRLLHLVADEATSQRTPLYIVGGFVRDLLLDLPSQDFDLVVEGDAIALANALVGKYAGRVTAHRRFGTAKWSIRASKLPDCPRSDLPDSLDLITARSESYSHPGALPSVHPGSLNEDLRRRDFTINTLALRLDGDAFGELRDDLGGLEDLKQGVVRVLHPDFISG